MGTPESQVTELYFVSQLLNIRHKDKAVIDLRELQSTLNRRKIHTA